MVTIRPQLSSYLAGVFQIGLGHGFGLLLCSFISLSGIVSGKITNVGQRMVNELNVCPIFVPQSKFPYL